MTRRTLWSLAMCLLCCQGVLTSIVALGWLYRWVRYTISKRLFYLSSKNTQTNWHQWASQQEDIISLQDSPKFFQMQRVKPGSKPGWFKRQFHSLGVSSCQGMAGILTIWSLTLGPCIIWALAWYTGWHISFNKIYEHSVTGFTIGSLALIVFSLLMLYIPIAQARHAFTGDWQEFYNFRMIRVLVCHRPLALFFLSIGYTITNGFVTLFKVLPAFFTAMDPTLEELSAVEALEHLSRYYFYTGLLLFLALFILKTWAGRIYAGSLVHLWRHGLVERCDFHEQESCFLEALGIDYDSQISPYARWQRILMKIGMIGYRGILTGAMILSWSLFNFLPFVSEFGHHVPPSGLLNQPLVQLPYFSYTPRRPRIESQP